MIEITPNAANQIRRMLAKLGSWIKQNPDAPGAARHGWPLAAVALHWRTLELEVTAR